MWYGQMHSSSNTVFDDAKQHQYKNNIYLKKQKKNNAEKQMHPLYPNFSNGYVKNASTIQ